MSQGLSFFTCQMGKITLALIPSRGGLSGDAQEVLFFDAVIGKVLLFGPTGQGIP